MRRKVLLLNPTPAQRYVPQIPVNNKSSAAMISSRLFFKEATLSPRERLAIPASS
jgi:hypothetical protein